MRLTYVAIDVETGEPITTLLTGETLTLALQDIVTGLQLVADGTWVLGGSVTPTYSASAGAWTYDAPNSSLTDGRVYQIASEGVLGGSRGSVPMMQSVIYTAPATNGSVAVEIAAYLDAQGHGTWDPDGPDGDIYVEAMPDTVDAGLCIYSSGGSPPDVATSLGRPAVQIIVRGTRSAYDTGQTARAILAALHGLHDMTFIDGGTRVMLCAARQTEPISLGRDENGRFQSSINFQIITGGD